MHLYLKLIFSSPSTADVISLGPTPKQSIGRIANECDCPLKKPQAFTCIVLTRLCAIESKETEMDVRPDF